MEKNIHDKSGVELIMQNWDSVKLVENDIEAVADGYCKGNKASAARIDKK